MKKLTTVDEYTLLVGSKYYAYGEKMLTIRGERTKNRGRKNTFLWAAG